MKQLYYVWIGEVYRSVLFDYNEAVEYYNQLVNKGYSGVYIEEVL